MPQLTLEYSNNLNQKINFNELFSKLHKVLEKLGDINIENCKSRATGQDTYYIGSGGQDKGFVHLTVKFLEGRTQELKNLIGENLLTELRNVYENISSKHQIQITVEILDIKQKDYFKNSS